MARQAHLLLIPYPAQGHVPPLLKLAQKIAERGIKVTFVNTEFIEAKIMATMPENVEKGSLIRFVSIPDGIEHGDDRNDPFKTKDCMYRVMPGHLKELIEKINQSDQCEPITCVVADICLGWALEIAHEMGIPRAALVPYGPPTLAISYHVKKFFDAGIIDNDGYAMPTTDEFIWISEGTLPWKRNKYNWSCPNEPKIQKVFLEITCAVFETVRISNWVLSNSIYELDSSNCDLVPKILPIGPLLASNHSGNLAGSLMLEDSTCLRWLDSQAIGSVIYVALGSTTTLSRQQFEELALGLESSGQPFLWVVRSNLVNESLARFPDGFREKLADRGKIVEWAAQEKVLAHPSVACFLSHCGWNSTMEGLSMGVPFLCWPYFADQYQNRRFICEVWKIGLDLTSDENGIISRQEIQRKVRKLINDDAIKSNSLKIKEMAGKSLLEGGSSFINFERFIDQVKSN
ncbi:UDP-glycosyltransferase 83A1-like [Mangifera indica]|uniref:UDP-glycosyltransferase 83A1-like n=1 Tax=Mangifera indica TaxID=29780 RepID=UPI001CFBEB48|nr:UDP-glycosyltransferase 83A1-like [Mangifera indica]